MARGSRERGRARLIAFLAVAILVLGLALAFRQWRAHSPSPPRVPPATPPAGSVPADSEAAIAQALALADPDSSRWKSRWLDQVRGADLAGLTPARLELFLRFANAERCTCGCGYTLAGCRASDMTCEVSGPHLDALLDSVRAGRILSAKGLRERPIFAQ